MVPRPYSSAGGLAPVNAAPQHAPRPLPLFLDLLRNETVGDPHRLARALKGLGAYQRAPRDAARPPRPVIATVGRTTLRRIGGRGAPLVLVPSLINPPDILDLVPGTSLGEFLAAAGFEVLIVDWGTPIEDDRGLDLAGHVADRLLPLLAGIERPHLLGYCLGGTLAMAVAALHPVASLVLLAAPWRFAGFPDEARRAVRNLWTAAEPVAEALGVLPMEVLQSAFWQIDPARTVTKFERFAEIDVASDKVRAFVRLEDWANAGAPLPLAAARELADGLFTADAPGEGRWSVGGRLIRPETIAGPILNILSETDRIVPAASAAPVGLEMRLGEGHVGMVVGGRARSRLWEPLARWLSAPAST